MKSSVIGYLNAIAIAIAKHDQREDSLQAKCAFWTSKYLSISIQRQNLMRGGFNVLYHFRIFFLRVNFKNKKSIYKYHVYININKYCCKGLNYGSIMLDQ